MNTLLSTSLSPDVLRASMAEFWNDQLAVETDGGRGLIAALPLMYPDGWQIIVHIEPFSATHVMITDKGHTLQKLQQEGLHIDARSQQTFSLLEERKKAFELEQKGYELCRLIPFPIQGLDVQLFAESIVSISHLVYRCEPRAVQYDVVHQSLQLTFQNANLHPKTGHVIAGRVESAIRVDYWFENQNQLAMKCVEIKERSRLRDYMERWAWRWTDLRNGNPDIRTAMIYDPDGQNWDDVSLAIGNDVCDLFAPVYERDRIIQRLHELQVA